MNRSRLQKISVACKTCDVSESFYSTTSVRTFKLAHLGHDVVERNPHASVEEAEVRVTDGEVRGEGGRARLLKVLVELVMLPSYSGPVFTITGIKDNMKSAFIQIIPPNQTDQVNETLEKGKFLESGASDVVYVWEPEAVSFSDDARLAMSFGDQRAERRPEPEQRVDPPAEVHHPSSTESRETVESPDGEDVPRELSSGSGHETSVLLALPVILPLSDPEPAASIPPPNDSQATKPPATAQSSSPPLREQELKPLDEGIPAPEGLKPETGSQGNAEEANYLLVSKSWYVESGPKNMDEAIRISRLLRPFRWRVEPAYTIGVIIDDLLSIETANGEIGGDMTKQVESAGYKLSRVIVDKGKPVAWFMKEDRA